jgi:hypothetical protein
MGIHSTSRSYQANRHTTGRVDGRASSGLLDLSRWYAMMSAGRWRKALADGLADGLLELGSLGHRTIGAGMVISAMIVEAQYTFITTDCQEILHEHLCEGGGTVSCDYGV